MKFKTILLCLFVWVVWYIIGNFHYEYNLIKNTTYTSLWWFYRNINEKRYGTPKDIIRNIFDDSLNNDWSSSSSSWDWIYYCSPLRIEEQEMQVLSDSYTKIGDNVFSSGKQIASCEENNCQINEKTSNILYDGKNTFYRWELLSWFDYKNLIILDEPYNVFTDKNKVYY